jgi:hypothetical protein
MDFIPRVNNCMKIIIEDSCLLGWFLIMKMEAVRSPKLQ